MSEVGRRKERSGLILNLKQSNRRGEVVTQHYSTQQGYSGLNSGVKGRYKGDGK
jgi:uncharacterized lipoprotein